MQLIIAAVGHKMPAWIENGFTEYVKRMPPELRIVLKEIKPVERSGSKTAATAMALERERIEAALPKEIRGRTSFGLITIDTERDTPAALHAYRATRKLPVDRWTLLRGAPDDTLELAALLGVKFKREASGQFAHSNLITVLNEQGEIIHQLTGLNQEVGETVKRIVSASAK